MKENKISRTIEDISKGIGIMEIRTEDEYLQSGEFLKKIAQTKKMVKEHFEPSRKEAHVKYQEVLNDIKFYSDKLLVVEKNIKGVINVYLAEERRRKAAIDQKNRKREEEMRLSEAIKKDDEKLLEKPIAVKVAPEPPKVKGMYTVKQWHWELENIGAVKKDFLQINEGAINSLVKSSHEEAVNMVGGIRVWSTDETRMRT